MCFQARSLEKNGALVHEALFYSCGDELVAGVRRFTEAGLARDEPVLIALPAANLKLISDALHDLVGGGTDPGRHPEPPQRTGLAVARAAVELVDMEQAGRNPSRILTLVSDWIDAHPGPVRFVGEPIWRERSDAEVVEGIRHEALLNLALAGSAATVLCPYDAEHLAPAVLASAELTHPLVAWERAATIPSPRYTNPLAVASAAELPLPEPPATRAEFEFDDDLHAMRAFVEHVAGRNGLSPTSLSDLVLALHELGANIVKHERAGGRVRIWHEDRQTVAEITGPSRIADPLIGRTRPPVDATDGRGLWLVNQLCDLVELRSHPATTTIRLHMRCDAA
jgi:anti-sigma regulatory factor (Ser/Thr protein kinase)